MIPRGQHESPGRTSPEASNRPKWIKKYLQDEQITTIENSLHRLHNPQSLSRPFENAPPSPPAREKKPPGFNRVAWKDGNGTIQVPWSPPQPERGRHTKENLIYDADFLQHNTQKAWSYVEPKRDAQTKQGIVETPNVVKSQPVCEWKKKYVHQDPYDGFEEMKLSNFERRLPQALSEEKRTWGSPVETPATLAHEPLDKQASEPAMLPGVKRVLYEMKTFNQREDVDYSKRKNSLTNRFPQIDDSISKFCISQVFQKSRPQFFISGADMETSFTERFGPDPHLVRSHWNQFNRTSPTQRFFLNVTPPADMQVPANSPHSELKTISFPESLHTGRKLPEYGFPATMNTQQWQQHQQLNQQHQQLQQQQQQHQQLQQQQQQRQEQQPMSALRRLGSETPNMSPFSIPRPIISQQQYFNEGGNQNVQHPITRPPGPYDNLHVHVQDKFTPVPQHKHVPTDQQPDHSALISHPKVHEHFDIERSGPPEDKLFERLPIYKYDYQPFQSSSVKKALGVLQKFNDLPSPQSRSQPRHSIGNRFPFVQQDAMDEAASTLDSSGVLAQALSRVGIQGTYSDRVKLEPFIPKPPGFYSPDPSYSASFRPKTPEHGNVNPDVPAKDDKEKASGKGGEGGKASKGGKASPKGGKKNGKGKGKGSGKGGGKGSGKGGKKSPGKKSPPAKGASGKKKKGGKNNNASPEPTRGNALSCDSYENKVSSCSSWRSETGDNHSYFMPFNQNANPTLRQTTSSAIQTNSHIYCNQADASMSPQMNFTETIPVENVIRFDKSHPVRGTETKTKIEGMERNRSLINAVSKFKDLMGFSNLRNPRTHSTTSDANYTKSNKTGLITTTDDMSHVRGNSSLGADRPFGIGVRVNRIGNADKRDTFPNKASEMFEVRGSISNRTPMNDSCLQPGFVSAPIRQDNGIVEKQFPLKYEGITGIRGSISNRLPYTVFNVPVKAKSMDKFSTVNRENESNKTGQTSVDMYASNRSSHLGSSMPRAKETQPHANPNLMVSSSMKTKTEGIGNDINPGKSQFVSIFDVFKENDQDSGGNFNMSEMRGSISNRSPFLVPHRTEIPSNVLNDSRVQFGTNEDSNLSKRTIRSNLENDMKKFGCIEEGEGSHLSRMDENREQKITQLQEGLHQIPHSRVHAAHEEGYVQQNQVSSRHTHHHHREKRRAEEEDTKFTIPLCSIMMSMSDEFLGKSDTQEFCPYHFSIDRQATDDIDNVTEDCAHLGHVFQMERHCNNENEEGICVSEDADAETHQHKSKRDVHHDVDSVDVISNMHKLISYGYQFVVNFCRGLEEDICGRLVPPLVRCQIGHAAYPCKDNASSVLMLIQQAGELMQEVFNGVMPMVTLSLIQEVCSSCQHVGEAYEKLEHVITNIIQNVLYQATRRNSTIIEREVAGQMMNDEMSEIMLNARLQALPEARNSVKFKLPQ